ncbi:MAG: hypothetical protein WCF84_07120 [Anaerolineae bacterium]
MFQRKYSMGQKEVERAIEVAKTIYAAVSAKTTIEIMNRPLTNEEKQEDQVLLEQLATSPGSAVAPSVGASVQIPVIEKDGFGLAYYALLDTLYIRPAEWQVE